MHVPNSQIRRAEIVRQSLLWCTNYITKHAELDSPSASIKHGEKKIEMMYQVRRRRCEVLRASTTRSRVFFEDKQCKKGGKNQYQILSGPERAWDSGRTVESLHRSVESLPLLQRAHARTHRPGRNTEFRGRLVRTTCSDIHSLVRIVYCNDARILCYAPLMACFEPISLPPFKYALEQSAYYSLRLSCMKRRPE